MTSLSRHPLWLPSLYPNAFLTDFTIDAILDQTDSQMNDLEGDVVRALDS